MKPVVIRAGEKWMFWCFGCGEHHWFGPPRWAWNGDPESPTVNPSIVAAGKCHLFIRGGKLVYLADCGHALAGKTVEMEPTE